MRSFKHITLDFENTLNIDNQNLKEYWALSFLNNSKLGLTLNKDLPSKNLSNALFFNIQNVLLLNSTNLYKNNKTSENYTLPTWYNLININFLRKERLYTKLKYSRSPAYDSVSGGAAALLAGFLGFLVSEKFGMELVDSGDFYFLTMYIVFLCFSIKPLLTVINPNNPFSDTLNPKNIIILYANLFSLLVKKFK